MKKNSIENIITNYLDVFPNETNRLQPLIDYLINTEEKLICDWNNTDGHLTAGAFIYSKQSNRFLVLWHRDLQMYLYAGGHCEQEHKSPLETAKLEVYEETGIINFEIKNLFKNEIIPIDIDIHKIPYNKRVNMSEHYHFDFRYIFLVEEESDVVVDKNEIGSFKWIDEKELYEDKNYGIILKKFKSILKI